MQRHTHVHEQIAGKIDNWKVVSFTPTLQETGWILTNEMAAKLFQLV